MIDGFEIAKAYEKKELCGWLEVRQPGIAKQQFNLLNDQGAFPQFKIAGVTRERRPKNMLYWYTRKVLGKDTTNYPQEIGDCVSFGAKNATEYVTCTQILGKAMAFHADDAAAFAMAVQAAALKFRSIFPPYFYGTGRHYIGQDQIRGDGSLGSWMAEAVKKYGALFSDADGVPAYSGRVATAWGDYNSKPDLDKFVSFASDYPVKTTALIRNWDDLCDAIDNQYACPTASEIGYNMEASSDGFQRQTTSWGHQMCFIGYDNGYKNGNEPYAIILNNWGDVHGHLTDFDDSSEKLPVGVLRVRRKDAEKHINAGETYAYSNFIGFPEQRLDKALFNLI